MTEKLSRKTLASQVYEYLRDRIVNLDIKPGEKIDVQQIARTVGVSPTPVREALHKLTEQGLVELKPYIGYFVTKLTADDLRKLFDLRKSLESLALKYIFDNVNEDKIRELLKELDRLEIDGFPVDGTREFDEAFHLGLLIRNSGNRWLEKFANGVIDLIRLTTYLSINPRAAATEHREILEALVQHDLDSALTALRKHLERAEADSIRAMVASRGDDNLQEESKRHDYS